MTAYSVGMLVDGIIDIVLGSGVGERVGSTEGWLIIVADGFEIGLLLGDGSLMAHGFLKF